MNTPNELKYSKSHEWVRFTSETECEVGLTDYAQDHLGDLVFVNLPEVDTEAHKEEMICDVESVKAVSDVYSPVDGVVCAVNEDLMDSPETINQDPYGAWIFKLTNVTNTDALLSAQEYEELCAAEGH